MPLPSLFTLVALVSTPVHIWGGPCGELPRRIVQINDAVNKEISYESDLAVHGKEDYWQSPVETLARGTGDCEDYAILKKVLLDGSLEGPSTLVLVFNKTSSPPGYHIVLRTKEGFILDNSTSKIYCGINQSSQFEITDVKLQVESPQP